MGARGENFEIERKQKIDLGDYRKFEMYVQKNKVMVTIWL